jgi:hypothetical protein
MARKHNSTGRTRHASRFAMLPHYLLESPAWRSLSLPGRAAFVELLALYLPGRNGRIAMSARTLADRLPISRATATRALQELVEKGFMTATRPGGFNVKSGVARATEWSLSLHKCDVTGAVASKHFMRWREGEKKQNAASPESHPGFTTGPAIDEIGNEAQEVALS